MPDLIAAAAPLTANVSDFNKTKTAESVTASLANGTVSTGTSALADGVTSQRTNDKLFNAKDTSMGKEQFLNLLVTQLRYQDPMNPQDNQEFAAQLAQFSALEGSQNVEKAMNSLSADIKELLGTATTNSTALTDAAKGIEDSMTSQNLGMWSLNNAIAVNLIGKDVRTSVNKIQISVSGEMAGIQYHLEGPAEQINAAIKDKLGNTIKNITPPLEDFLSGGDKTIVWDGTDNNGDTVPRGNYTVNITATMNGQALNAYSYLEGRVSEVNYLPTGEIMLHVVLEDGTEKDLSMSGVTAVKG
jgi:flagellar basal-body rod modification protein FlgD